MSVIHRVTMKPGDDEFTVAPGEALLNAALRQGVSLRYGCRHGNCSSCKYFVIEGDVDLGPASPYSLSENERAEGWALLCCATALSDLVIQDFGQPDLRALPVLAPESRAAVMAVSRPLDGGLWWLELELREPLSFYAGQFVELEVPGSPGQWRSYSIATPPSSPGRLGFVVKRIEEGRFSGQLGSLPTGVEVSLRGPYGTGYLRAGDRPIVLVATGAGIAPLRSILSHAADTADTRRFRLFYGARSRSELVFTDELAELAAALDLTVRYTLSRPTPDCAWDGSVGRVTSLVQREVDDASTIEAYLCGNPDMCDSVALLLEAKGIDEHCIHFDRFYPTGDLP